MKKVFLALMCVGALLMTACDPQNPTNGKTYAGDKWITSPEQFDMSIVDNKTNSCWEWHIWCDGTTMNVEPFWGTEAQLLWMIDLSMQAELKVFGEYHKKYRYYLVEENTEEACLGRQWEGAECWLETITWIDSRGVQHTSQEYGWMPEANMKERHDYYMEKLEQIGVANHEYERVTDKTDKDACWAMNPEDSTIVTPPDPKDPKDYSQYDSTTYKCWEITQVAYGMTITNYRWETEKVIVMMYDLINIDYTYRHVTDAEDEDACEELDELVERPEACWKITATVMGTTTVSYYWGTEAEAEAQVDAIISTGMGTASYVLTPATDADGCHE